MARSDNVERAQLTRADLWIALLLTLTCLVLRLPTLDRIGLNPDESQYEASAAYLAANGQSAFAFPYGVPWTMTLYKGVASVFGPYSMPVVRTLVMLIALASAWILYDVLRRVAGRGAGLLAGVLFLHINQGFQGWTANREWFSFFPFLLGIYLVTLAWRRPDRGRWWLWLVAGMLCGMSLWFKRQASFLVLVVPVVLVWQAWVEPGALRARLRGLLPFAAGGLLAGVLFVLPFLIHGTADAYVGSLFEDYSLYIDENAVREQARAGGALELYASRLFWNLPYRAIFLVSYAFCGIVLTGALLRGFRRPAGWSGAGRPEIVLFAVYLAAALACVQLGNRFFAHYFLYVMAPLAALFVLAAHRLGKLADSPAARGIALAVAGLYVIDRAFDLSSRRLDGVDVVYVIAAVAIVGFALLRPLRRAGTMLVALLLLESAVVVLQEQRRPVPPSFPYHADAFEQLVDRVTSIGNDGDRLFVWGWLPEIYSATRLEPASHMTITEYIVEDYYVTPRGPTINQPFADLLMRDLQERPPRFIVDATLRSWTMVAGGNPGLYRLDQYPEFELVWLLREDYRLVGVYSDCKLYVRRKPLAP